MAGPLRPYLDFADTFLAERPDATAARVPTEATVELTKRCSLRCSHCYIGDGRWIPDPAEITSSELLELFRVLRERGTLWLTFTGGEPLSRADFPELWRAAHAEGFLLQLFTNATLLDDRIASLLSELPPVRIEVSIYGASKETYERLSQVPGSYERFLRGLAFLPSIGAPWLLKAPVLRENLEELPALREFARRRGVPLFTTSLINPSTGFGKTGGQAPCATRLPPELAAAQELGDGERPRPAPQAPGEADLLFDCGAGRNSLYVAADAKLQMCNMTGHRGEGLRGASVAERFDKAWRSFGSAREIRLAPGSPCISCDLRSICKNCPGFAQLENQNESSAVEWICRQTHIKAEKLGIPHRCDSSHFGAGSNPEGL